MTNMNAISGNNRSSLQSNCTDRTLTVTQQVRQGFSARYPRSSVRPDQVMVLTNSTREPIGQSFVTSHEDEGSCLYSEELREKSSQTQLLAINKVVSIVKENGLDVGLMSAQRFQVLEQVLALKTTIGKALLTSKEAATLLRMSDGALRKQRSARSKTAIPHLKEGNRIFYDADEIFKYLSREE